MNKIVLLVTSLFLTSCIVVDDWGRYWERGNIDPGILGYWQLVFEKTQADNSKSQTYPENLKTSFSTRGKEINVGEYKHGEQKASASEFQTKDAVVHFIADGKNIIRDEYKDGKKDDDPHNNLHRTLNVGPYHFLLVKDNLRSMFRYEMRGNSLIFFDENEEAIREYLKKNFPDVQDIVVPDHSGDELSFTEVRINHFTDEVFDILSKIPDDSTFWIETSRYERIP